MKILKNRKTNLISKKKLTSAINLYEKYVDEEIISISIYNYTNNVYHFKSNKDNYHVDIALNKVEKVYDETYDD